MKIIKELKNILGLGLKEAKEMTEKVPLKIKEGCSKSDAEELVEKLKALGCELEIL